MFDGRCAVAVTSQAVSEFGKIWSDVNAGRALIRAVLRTAVSAWQAESTSVIGKIERVPLRQVWPHEAIDWHSIPRTRPI